MNTSSIMINSYNPYGDYNSDILNIIESEKKNYNDKKIHYEKRKELDLSMDSISNEIMKVLTNLSIDIKNKNYNGLLLPENRRGLGYIFIIIYIIYYLVKF